MNKETMIKHYERTPKETLINILISSREQVDKLQKRNEERKQEIERLNNIINKAVEYIESKVVSSNEVIDQLRKSEVRELLDFLIGSDKE